MISRKVFRKRANAIARTTLGPLPLKFWENAFPKDVIALCYHVVSDADLPHLQLYPYKDTARFEADVLFARDRALTYRQVIDRRIHNERLPANGILFTFDDGLVQCYEAIRPILKRHRVDAVFFVTTDYLDDRESFFESALSLCLSKIASLEPDEARAIVERVKPPSEDATSSLARETRARGRAVATRLRIGDDPWKSRLMHHAFGLTEDDAELPRLCAALNVDVASYAQHSRVFMTRDQIRELVADGFTIGAHGRKHRSLEGASPTEVEREIVASCEAVRAITGCDRVPFAFPYSGIGVDRSLLALIMERNPIVEMIFDSGSLRNDPAFIVNRVFADGPTPRQIATNVPRTLRDAWSVPSAWFRK